MDRRTLLTGFGSAMLIAGAGCTSNENTENKMSELDNVKNLQSEGLDSVEVIRFIDREAGMVIYQRDGTIGGMTSVPLSETDL
jgi:hypothetical protein